MTRERNALRLQVQCLGQLQPNHGQGNWNASARPQDLVDVTVFRGVVIVGVDTKAQLFVKNLCQQGQTGQIIGVIGHAHRDPFEQAGHIVQHLLYIQRRLFVLRQTCCGFQQRKLFVALHQTGKVAQRRQG